MKPLQSSQSYIKGSTNIISNISNWNNNSNLYGFYTKFVSLSSIHKPQPAPHPQASADLCQWVESTRFPPTSESPKLVSTTNPCFKCTFQPRFTFFIWEYSWACFAMAPKCSVMAVKAGYICPERFCGYNLTMKCLHMSGFSVYNGDNHMYGLFHSIENCIFFLLSQVGEKLNVHCLMFICVYTSCWFLYIYKSNKLHKMVSKGMIRKYDLT